MSSKKKRILLFQRLFIWIIYLSAGIILYSNKVYLFPFLITFARILYPLSIFWLQIRLKNKGNFLQIDSSMATSQLWFNILPVLASFITVILSTLNLLRFITDKLI